jgi:tRNA modification GTPase
MGYLAGDQQTICAVSTPSGFGGISVIRVSGTQAYGIVRKISKGLPEIPESHRVYLASLFDLKFVEFIDQVLVTFFREGQSFTGEEVVEVSCHGNPLICETILSQLILGGARASERGEFTYRAFMNGKLDLVQAESVLSLIESQSQAARSLALRQLKGHLSASIAKMEDLMVWCLAHIEASIDFSTEGLEVVSESELNQKLTYLSDQLAEMVEGYRNGRIIKDGFRVALVGRPNVGKSSLLNFLCGEDHAIVTPIAGTTRDVVVGELLYGGQKLSFIDTAGLREDAVDEVERIGISRSRARALEADLVVFVFDLSVGISIEDLVEFEKIGGLQNVIVLGSKADLVTDKNPMEKMREEMQKIHSLGLSRTFKFDVVSVLRESDKALILEWICSYSRNPTIDYGAVISQVRHFEELNKAMGFMLACREEFSRGIGAEFIALSLKEALLCVQRVLGKSYDDDVLDRVFKEFCLGK